MGGTGDVVTYALGHGSVDGGRLELEQGAGADDISVRNGQGRVGCVRVLCQRLGASARAGAKQNAPGTPRSQPEMNAPAMARTSLGRKAMSKAWGMDVPLLRTLRIVWWRASVVKIEPAATRRTGSSSNGAAPRYAATPRFSTTRAVAAMVLTSFSAPPKSKLQFVMGVSPRDWIVAWNREGRCEGEAEREKKEEDVLTSRAVACAASSAWI